MNRRETIQANHAIEFTECLPNRSLTADVIARSKNMRGIEANTQPLRLAHAADNVGEMVEFVSQT